MGRKQNYRFAEIGRRGVADLLAPWAPFRPRNPSPKRINVLAKIGSVETNASDVLRFAVTQLILQGLITAVTLSVTCVKMYFSPELGGVLFVFTKTANYSDTRERISQVKE